MNSILRSKVSIAPMAGLTDIVLRGLIRKFSKKCLMTTEMISSEALMQRFESKIIERNTEDSPIAYQLTGHKPQMMAKAAKMLEDRADILDINMGCPVKKVTCGGDGSALMRTPELAYDIVKAVNEAIKIPVSVKFRLGYSKDEENFVEFGQKMQEAGAKFITLHARTRKQMYSGNADWQKIRLLKENVDIPVFANGDIKDVESAIECLEISKADGIAIGRGILGNPDLAHRIEHYIDTGEVLKEICIYDKIEILKKHVLNEIKLRGEKDGIPFVRKFYSYYLNSFPKAAKYRGELVLMNDIEKIIKTLNEIQNFA